jgi:hypothetical protein
MNNIKRDEIDDRRTVTLTWSCSHFYDKYESVDNADRIFWEKHCVNQCSLMNYQKNKNRIDNETEMNSLSSNTIRWYIARRADIVDVTI